MQGALKKLRKDLVHVAVCGLVDLKLLDQALEVEVLPMSWTSCLWDNRSLLSLAQVGKDKVGSYLGYTWADCSRLSGSQRFGAQN